MFLRFPLCCLFTGIETDSRPDPAVLETEDMVGKFPRFGNVVCDVQHRDTGLGLYRFEKVIHFAPRFVIQSA